MQRLKDKVAIISGGGKGIGRAISLAYASEGAALVAAGRSLSALEETAAEIRNHGGKASAVQTDVADEAQVRHLVRATMEQYGRIDILVNNSGITGPVATVGEMDLAAWNETMAVNLTGAMLCAREVLAHMIPRRTGTIINIASEGGRGCDGRAGFPRRAAYCCSKMGIIGLTETMAIEVGEHGIRVNAISPAGVVGERITNLMKNRAAGLGITTEELMARHVASYSLGRMATEAEIAAVAVFLASDESACITGQVVVANCGQHIVH